MLHGWPTPTETCQLLSNQMSGKTESPSFRSGSALTTKSWATKSHLYFFRFVFVQYSQHGHQLDLIWHQLLLSFCYFGNRHLQFFQCASNTRTSLFILTQKSLHNNSCTLIYAWLTGVWPYYLHLHLTQIQIHIILRASHASVWLSFWQLMP